jgi:hypothetical protein
MPSVATPVPRAAVRLPLLPARDDTVHAAMGLLGARHSSAG